MKFFEILGKILLGIVIALGGLITAVLVSPFVVLFVLIDLPICLVECTFNKDEEKQRLY
jgi:hypothetical protein